MRSWFNTIWKYILISGLALPISGTAGSVFGSHIPLHYLLKEAFQSNICLQSSYFGQEAKNSILEKNPCSNTTKNCQVFIFDILSLLNPLYDLNQNKSGRFVENHFVLSRSQFFFTKLTTGNYKRVSVPKSNRSGTQFSTHMVELNIWHPWQSRWAAEVAVLFFLLTAVVFIVHISISRIKKIEREKNEINNKMIEFEFKALQAQINPHFIYNSINSIQYLVLSNKTDDVLSYLSDFSKVMRISLSNVTNKMVLLNDEIDFLNSYLRIERMRFAEKFGFSVKINESLDPKAVKIPPYLIQPFAENAIQHGFMYNQVSGNLTISLEHSDSETIKCTITDDGNRKLNPNDIDASGYDYPKPTAKKITETRIQLLNTESKPGHYHVEYSDLSDNEGNTAGLKVEIYLPFENA